MAVKFSSSFSTLFTYSIFRMFGYSDPRFALPSLGITVYSGTMPSSTSTVIDNWTTYNQSSALCLWHASSGVVYSVIGNNVLNASSLPAAAAPLRNGTATWFIQWPIGSVNINTTTIPTTQFMMGDVSALFGNGVCKFIDNVLVTTTAVTISELNFKINYIG